MKSSLSEVRLSERISESLARSRHPSMCRRLSLMSSESAEKHVLENQNGASHAKNPLE